MARRRMHGDEFIDIGVPGESIKFVAYPRGAADGGEAQHVADLQTGRGVVQLGGFFGAEWFSSPP